VIGALVAGIAGMDWWRFLVWNVAGAVVWATGVALIAYSLGEAVASAMGRYGLIGGAGVIVAAAVFYGLVHGLRRWRVLH
jgi:membrane protein DedA with SNARE-associated domain